MIENKRKIRIIGVMVLAVIVSVVVMSIAVKFGTVNNINISTVETSEKTTDSDSQDTTEYDETRPDPEHYGETHGDSDDATDEEDQLLDELGELLQDAVVTSGEKGSSEEDETQSDEEICDDYVTYNTPLEEYGFYNIDDFGALVRIMGYNEDYVYGCYDNVGKYWSTNRMLRFTGNNVKDIELNSYQDILNMSGTLVGVDQYEIVDNDTLRVGNNGGFVSIKERNIAGDKLVLVLDLGTGYDWWCVPRTMLECDEAEDFEYREEDWHPNTVSHRYKIPWK